METFFSPRVREIQREKTKLEKKLKVSINVHGRWVTIDGPALEEYEASFVFDAINLGYPVDIALMAKDEEMIFKKLSIKDFTRRVDLETVKARLIGTQGRTKRTIENIADCYIRVQGNEVGILGAAEEVEYAITAITNLIRGSKQANVYKFLERINTQKKKIEKQEKQIKNKRGKEDVISSFSS